MVLFYGKGLLAPHQTPKVEEFHMSDVVNCLFSPFTAAFISGGHIHPQAGDECAVVTGHPVNMFNG
jgi:hypothetical protein